MTTPVEGWNAIEYARSFLRSLLDPRTTPRIPRPVRREAYTRLRHFPAEVQMEEWIKRQEWPP